MSHYHHWLQSFVPGMSYCACGATNPPSVPRSTSERAAERIAGKAPTLRERVYVYIKSHGPCTDEDVQRALEMNPSTERPRRVELLREGRVRDTGRVSRTSSGRSAVLWEAA